MFAIPVSLPVSGKTYNPQKAGTWPQTLTQIQGKAGTCYKGKKPKLYRKSYLDKDGVFRTYTGYYVRVYGLTNGVINGIFRELCDRNPWFREQYLIEPYRLARTAPPRNAEKDLEAIMTEPLGRRRLSEYKKFLPNQPSRKLPDWCLKEAGYDDNIRGYAPALVNHVPVVVPKTAFSQLLHKVIYGEEMPDQEDVVSDDGDDRSDKGGAGSDKEDSSSDSEDSSGPSEPSNPGSYDREDRSDSGSFSGGEVNELSDGEVDRLLKEFKIDVDEPRSTLTETFGPAEPATQPALLSVSSAAETVPAAVPGTREESPTWEGLAKKIAALQGAPFKGAPADIVGSGAKTLDDIPMQAEAMNSATKEELLAMLPKLSAQKVASPKEKRDVIYSAVKRLYTARTASNLGVDPSVVHSLIDPLRPHPQNKRGLRRPSTRDGSPTLRERPSGP